MIADSNLLQSSLGDLFDRFNCAKSGLSTEAAQRRLLESGPNEPVVEGRNGEFGELLRGLANPLVIILLTASVISAMVGELVNALIIVTIIVLSVPILLKNPRSPFDKAQGERGGD